MPPEADLEIYDLLNDLEGFSSSPVFTPQTEYPQATATLDKPQTAGADYTGKDKAQGVKPGHADEDLLDISFDQLEGALRQDNDLGEGINVHSHEGLNVKTCCGRDHSKDAETYDKKPDYSADSEIDSLLSDIEGFSSSPVFTPQTEYPAEAAISAEPQVTGTGYADEGKTETQSYDEKLDYANPGLLDISFDQLENALQHDNDLGKGINVHSHEGLNVKTCCGRDHSKDAETYDEKPDYPGQSEQGVVSGLSKTSNSYSSAITIGDFSSLDLLPETGALQTQTISDVRINEVGYESQTQDLTGVARKVQEEYQSEQRSTGKLVTGPKEYNPVQDEKSKIDSKDYDLRNNNLVDVMQQEPAQAIEIKQQKYSNLTENPQPEVKTEEYESRTQVLPEIVLDSNQKSEQYESVKSQELQPVETLNLSYKTSQEAQTLSGIVSFDLTPQTESTSNMLIEQLNYEIQQQNLTDVVKEVVVEYQNEGGIRNADTPTSLTVAAEQYDVQHQNLTDVVKEVVEATEINTVTTTSSTIEQSNYQLTSETIETTINQEIQNYQAQTSTSNTAHVYEFSQMPSATTNTTATLDLDTFTFDAQLNFTKNNKQTKNEVYQAETVTYTQTQTSQNYTLERTILEQILNIALPDKKEIYHDKNDEDKEYGGKGYGVKKKIDGYNQVKGYKTDSSKGSIKVNDSDETNLDKLVKVNIKKEDDETKRTSKGVKNDRKARTRTPSSPSSRRGRRRRSGKGNNNTRRNKLRKRKGKGESASHNSNARIISRRRNKVPGTVSPRIKRKTGTAA